MLVHRDAMAKAVYAALFNWIVRRVNTSIDKENAAADGGFNLDKPFIGACMHAYTYVPLACVLASSCRCCPLTVSVMSDVSCLTDMCTHFGSLSL